MGSALSGKVELIGFTVGMMAGVGYAAEGTMSTLGGAGVEVLEPMAGDDNMTTLDGWARGAGRGSTLGGLYLWRRGIGQRGARDSGPEDEQQRVYRAR